MSHSGLISLLVCVTALSVAPMSESLEEDQSQTLAACEHHAESMLNHELCLEVNNECEAESAMRPKAIDSQPHTPTPTPTTTTTKT